MPTGEKHSILKDNVPSAGDWISLEEKAYQVIKVDYIQKSGWLSLKLKTMLGQIVWIEFSPRNYFNHTSYPFWIFSKSHK